MRKFSEKLFGDTRGMMAVETAIVSTTVALLSLGSFQVSSFVARQNEMQGAAADAEAIILASRPTSTDQLSTIQSIITSSTGIAAAPSSGDWTTGIKIQFVYRCGTSSTLLTSPSSCNNNGSNKLWTYVRVTIKDRYSPLWSSFGVASGVSLNVDRTVQVS